MGDVESEEVGSVMVDSYLDNRICLRANLLDCGDGIGGRLGWRMGWRWWRRGSHELFVGGMRSDDRRKCDGQEEELVLEIDRCHIL